MSERSRTERIGNFLILVGALISILYSVLLLLGFPYTSFLPGILGQFFPSNVRGFLLLILGILTLIYSGFFRNPWAILNRWALVLILGFLLFLIGGEFGGLLVMVGGVLTLLG